MEKGSDQEEKTYGKDESALKSLQNCLYRPLSLSMGFRGVERQKRAVPVANFQRIGINICGNSVACYYVC